MPDTGKNAVKTYDDVNGTQTDFEITYGYLEKGHVEVYSDAPPNAPTNKLNYPGDYDFTGTNDNTIRFTVAPASGNTVTIQRKTPSASLLETFADGSPVQGAKLNRALQQGLYYAEEVADST